MTSTETRAELHRMVNLLPEDSLGEALGLLKAFLERQEELRYERNFDRIIKDNYNLLKRLAD